MSNSMNPTILRHEPVPKLGFKNINEDTLCSERFIYDFDNNSFPAWYIRSNYPNYMFDYHYHEHIEIILLNEGKIKISSDFGKFTLKAGEILVANRNEVHSGFFYDNIKSLVDYTVVTINIRSLANQPNPTVNKIFKNLIVGKMKVKNHIMPNTDGYDELREVIFRTGEYYRKQMSAFLQIGLAMEIFAAMEDCGVIYTTKIEAKTKDKDFSVHVLNYVQSNYKDKITTKTASSFFAYDEAQFCRIFKKHFNMTFIGFLNFYRIKMACCYSISDKSITIEDIAKEVGYDNYSYFCRNFKKHTGKTPKEFFHNSVDS